MDDNHKNQHPAPAQPQAYPQQAQQQQAQQQQGLTPEQKQYAKEIVMQRYIQKAQQDQYDFVHRQSHIKDMLAPENRNNHFVIGSRKEFLAMDAAYKALSNKDENYQDEQVTMDGYPKTDADWVARTAELAAAITDCSNILDKPTKRHTGEEINTAVSAVNSLSTFEVQLLAGKILVATCDAHEGRYNVPSWSKALKKAWYQSFNDRFRDVCRSLTQRKALVKSILDAETPFAMRLASGPDAEFKMKGGNERMNNKRAEEKQDLKKRLRLANDNHGDNDGKDGDAAPEKGSGAPMPKLPEFPRAAYRDLRPLSPLQRADKFLKMEYNSDEAAGGFVSSPSSSYNDAALDNGLGTSGFAGHMPANNPQSGSFQSGGMYGAAAGNGLGHSASQPASINARSPDGLTENQGLPRAAGTTQAEGSINVATTGWVPVEFNDTSLGPLEEVEDDNPLFESEDFNCAGPGSV